MECLFCNCILGYRNKTKVCTQCQKSRTEYRIWMAMKDRCLNKNTPSYKNYGGRGITICDEWINSFARFYSDMGNRPSLLLTLDRKDNSSGYNKDNCKWSTKSEQNSNQRIRKDTSTGVKYINLFNNYLYVVRYKGKYLGSSNSLITAKEILYDHIKEQCLLLTQI